MRWGVSVIALSILMSLGCGAPLTGPLVPLFDKTAESVFHGSTARLFGPITTVDGADVPQLASGFELLPGRHTVRTRGEAVAPTPYVTVVGRPGARTFELTMKPGHIYVIKQRILDELGGALRVGVIAEELDQAGAYVQTVEPTVSSGDDVLLAIGFGGVIGLAQILPNQTKTERPAESANVRPSEWLAPR